MLGQILLYGYGITKDRKGAQACFYNAANGGHVESQFLFGKMFIEDGNPALGNVYLIRAAENKHDIAYIRV